MAATPGSLRALLSKLIDYAGLYPPAALPLPAVLQKYEAYRASPEAWMLNRLVLPATALGEARVKDGWRVTLLADGEPGELPPQVETFETKAPSRLSLPTYCETPLDLLGDGAFAKIRTGGLTPEAIPGSADVAAFLADAAARRIPFKATGGLHHPIRSVHPLTYEKNSQCATMHGFINVFAAAAFAWNGMDRSELTRILDEEDPLRFEFRDDELLWRGRRLDTESIRAARADFAHSFGSCLFEEPVADLRGLGLLP